MVKGRESIHAPPIGGLNGLTSLSSSGPSKPCSCLILEETDIDEEKVQYQQFIPLLLIIINFHSFLFIKNNSTKMCPAKCGTKDRRGGVAQQTEIS